MTTNFRESAIIRVIRVMSFPASVVPDRIATERFRRAGIRARQNRCPPDGRIANPSQSQPLCLVFGDSDPAGGQRCPPYGPDSRLHKNLNYIVPAWTRLGSGDSDDF